MMWNGGFVFMHLVIMLFCVRYMGYLVQQASSHVSGAHVQSRKFKSHEVTDQNNHYGL